MSADELSARLKQQPFVPFQLQLAGGESREVRHPERLWVFPELLVIGYPDPALPWPAIDRYETFPLEEIQALKQVSSTA